MRVDVMPVLAMPNPNQTKPTLDRAPLYVVGGEQRTPRSLTDQGERWYDYQQGVLLRVDPAHATVETSLKYTSRPGVCAPSDPILFKSGTRVADKLYLCTQTEVMTLQLPELTQIAHCSLPCFNDIHHVRPTAQGTLLVAISGLDLVVEITPEGTVLREWDVYDGQPWTRFARHIDYRQGISTKPHHSHPNYVFTIGDEIWATRFEQRDAICLTHPDRVIHIGSERVHDGYLHAGLIYFTTVDGKVIIVDAATLQIEQTIDLTALHDAETLLGWCRGILVEGNLAWVGFSRIRPTKFREAVSWVRTGFKQSRPTHIACYDLVAARCVAEIELEEHDLNAVFSILPASGHA